MRRVRIFGPIGDTSGYGNAVKNFAEAFSISKIPTKFEFSHQKKKLISHLIKYQGQTDTDFYLHCPPYDKHKSQNYKIAYFYWEADRLPSSWVRSLKSMNEVWVPCKLVKDACINSGFNGKIKVIPTPIKPFDLNNKIGIPAYFSKEYILSNDVFKFYSIFQWHERKGYKELLKSYFSEFTSDDNVILILKVNPLNVNGYTENKIYQDIQRVKNYLGKASYPPIFLSKNIIDSSDIYALHNIGDCYVSPHHGEGWGMPIHDAMFAGKQIITTKFGGVTEYLNSESAHLINYELKPISGMEWSPLYSATQKWAYPNVKHLSYLMRDVYTNHKQYFNKSINAQKIASSMDIKTVATLIERELL